MQTFHPTLETQMLLEEYQKEYKRTTGKLIGVSIRYGWVTLDQSGSKSKLRLQELRAALERLKQRPSHTGNIALTSVEIAAAGI